MILFTALGQTIDEYRVKAAFLYNFAKFVEWPPQTFKTDKDPIRICIMGQDPFGQTLVDMMAGKTIFGRPIVFPTPGQVSQCHVLFVSSSEKNRLRPILKDLQTCAVLTVGETEGFAAQGGIVNFKLERGRVRLEINAEAAEKAKLRISSKVLNLAEIVKSDVQK